MITRMKTLEGLLFAHLLGLGNQLRNKPLIGTNMSVLPVQTRAADAFWWNWERFGTKVLRTESENELHPGPASVPKTDLTNLSTTCVQLICFSSLHEQVYYRFAYALEGICAAWAPGVLAREDTIKPCTEVVITERPCLIHIPICLATGKMET